MENPKLQEIEIIDWGLLDYGRALVRQQQMVADRIEGRSPDRLVLVEHPPVVTIGRSGSLEDLHLSKNALGQKGVSLQEVDRGGRATFHGPGQLMVYPLIDIRRANIGVRKLVTALEQSVVDLAAEYDVAAAARADAPGVYVEGNKLASVGLRIRRGSSFHGMALNVDVDLEPFTRINPCGYAELEMTDLHRLGIHLLLEETSARLLPHFLHHLGLEA